MNFEAWKADFLNRTNFPPDLSHLLQYLPAPAKADATQAEARKTLKQYLALTVSDTRIAKGREKLREYQETFAKIENTYGVDRHILLAIWGMETNFGTIRGDIPVFAALATLAHQGRRRALFETQLIGAAAMVTHGQASPDQMIGSWAGAMGHTQFMPTSYRDHAVPGADIWGNDPTDALTSTANYLVNHGWIPAPWGALATWPDTLDLHHARHHPGQTLEQWQALGVKSQVTNPDLSKTLWRFTLPAGFQGPAFLTTANYQAILAYNNAPAYAVAVGHLADRIWGDGPLNTNWGDDETALSQPEMADLQTQLTTLGFDTQGADGFTGPNTVKAIEDFQAKQNLPVDGFAGPSLLKHLISLF